MGRIPTGIFMLFLAVFLGFVAENIKENYVDIKKKRVIQDR